MKLNEAIKYLEKSDPYGIKLGLDRMRTLLAYLDNPQEKVKCIHVAGTNGKGSVCAMLQSILVESGYRVGIFNSPHLMSYKEYLMINGVMATDTTFCYIVEKVKTVIQTMVEEGHEHPTKFEIITAMAFCYFAKEKVDYAIIEVGLGGRNDSTNVIKSPLLSIITTIDYDHTNILGDTIEAITYEKAGIIKKGCPALTSNTNDKILRVLIDTAKEERAQFIHIEERYRILEEKVEGTLFEVEGIQYFVALPGEVQVINATLVIKAIEVLNDQYGLKIQLKQIQDGLENVKWMGRLEKIKDNPEVIIDGCHNDSSVDNLIKYVHKFYKNRRIILITSMFKDKNYKRNLVKLLASAEVGIVTEIPNNTRTLTIENIRHTVYEAGLCNNNIIYIKHYTEALKKAFSIYQESDIIIIAGSFYLVGSIRNILA